jgi:hypothetical protein
MKESKEIYPDPEVAKMLEENYNKIEGRPPGTPLWHENHYYGTIPPTFIEWVTEMAIGHARYGVGASTYRVFKNTYGTYTIQDVGVCDSVNVATGDLDCIIEIHKKLTGKPPDFIQKHEDIT